MTRFLLALVLILQITTTARTGVVTGILRTDSGNPIPNVRVAVSPASGQFAEVLLESLTLTDSDGRYRLEDVTPGHYLVIVGRGSVAQYHPGVAEPSKATWIAVTAGETVMVPDMVQARTVVSGKVIDLAAGNGRKIQTLSLCCDLSTLAENAASMVQPYKTIVEENGAFTFYGIIPGKYAIYAADPQIVSMAQAITIGEADIEGLEIKVASGVAVEGTIHDRNGKPVRVLARLRRHPDNQTFESSGPPLGMSIGSGVAKDLMEEIFVSATLSQSVRARTLQVLNDGRFTFTNVLPGRYILEVGAIAATLLEHTVEVGVAGVHDLRVDLLVGEVTGRVVVADEANLPKLSGSVRAVKSNAPDEIQYAFPDEAGRFSLLLSAGDYKIFPQSLGRSVRSVSVGSKNLSTDIFSFNGISSEEIVIEIEP